MWNPERTGEDIPSKQKEHIITGECDEEDIRVEDNNEKIERLTIILDQYKNFFDWRKHREKGGVFALRHQKEYFPPKSEWVTIYERLDKLPAVLGEMAEKPGIKFDPKSHVFHLLRNSTLGKLGSMDKFTSRLVEKGGDFTPYSGLAKDSLEAIYLLVYYLDLLENDKSILEKELTSEDGWLESFKGREFFLKDTEDGKLIMERINFFSRLENKWESSLGNLGGLKEKNGVIDENNFDEEFERLQGKDLFNKDKIKAFYGFSNKQEKVANF